MNHGSYDNDGGGGGGGTQMIHR